MKKGYVISDIHMFAGRSDTARCEERVRELLDDSEFMVLNGDIFDFRWTMLEDIPSTVKAARLWLNRLVDDYPKTSFYYVLGNHDCLKDFVLELDDLCQKKRNLLWHPTHLVMGDTLFLHGDLPLSKKWRQPFDRELIVEEEKKSPFLNQCYHLVVESRAHNLVTLLHGKRRCAKRIYRSLLFTEGIDEKAINKVYFGHTHVHFEDHEHQGIRFHNTGSGVKKQRFHALPVALPDDAVPEDLADEVEKYLDTVK